ncbi:MAG: glycosyltransferase family 2 protein [Nanoarchaeota archaeon]
MDKIDFSIVIPTYNESRDIADCLNAISMQDYPRDKFEVIIVDNYSQDNTLNIVKTFSKKINLKILMNKIKDAEVSKMLGFKKAKGKFFMYLDADMQFSDKNFIKKMLYPFSDDSSIAGVFIKFLVNKNHPALTRTLSYDEWQRDPIFRYFTIGAEEIIQKKRKNYYLCKCNTKKIPPQGLMIYKKALIEEYAKNQKQLIDNEIPAFLVSQGHFNFAFVPDAGVYHFLLRSLKELAHKRIRNLQRTYYPNKEKRLFKWIDWKSDWPKVGIWLIYTHSIILPVFSAIIKALKHNDVCFLNEPMLNLVSTYSIIYGVLSNLK